MLLKGQSLLEDDTRLGAAVETAFFKHVFSRYYAESIAFSYWRNNKTDQEVDIVAEARGELIPFEVKYSNSPIEGGDIKGLRQLCDDRKIARAYVITKKMNDFGLVPIPGGKTAVLMIPAPLACFWLSQSEGA